MKIGILVSNLGTPSAPTTKAIRQYLAEFLSDPAVVKIPSWLWLPLLHGLVLRRRPKKSSQLYKMIWTNDGSPLLSFSKRLTTGLQQHLQQENSAVEVALGMRYGEPSLKNALHQLRIAEVTKILVLPLYPQYSFATTESTRAKILQHIKKFNWDINIDFILSYATHPIYINALTEQIRNSWQRQKPGQKILFSFHGLPKSSLKQGDPYFSQCQATSRLIASRLQLNEEQWQMVFQSRFGRNAWLTPYCNEMLQLLPSEGYHHIDIICPGFAVDCLETLEEIAITNKNIFYNAGGKSYHYISALNDSTLHIELLSQMIKDHLENPHPGPFPLAA